MRGMLLIGAVIVGVVAFTATGLAATTSDPKAPTLRLVSTSPLTIAGARFRPGEIVRVVVRSDRTAERRIKVAPTGRFRVVIEWWVFDRCGAPLLIRAIGARGGFINMKRPQPLCPPPIDGSLGGAQP